MGVSYGINRLFNLQDTNFMVYDMDVKEDCVTFTIKHKEQAFYICKRCGHHCDAYHDKDWITLWDIPMGMKRVKWRVERMRILCHCSLNYLVEDLPFRSEQHQLTQRFVDYIEFTLCTKMFTVADVARLFNLDYGVVYKIDHQVLLRMWRTLDLPDPVHIAVDEKSYKRGHRYVTVVSDVERKMVIWVSEGNSKDSLDEFFKVIGSERCAKIKTVAKDLHKPYAASCAEYVPQAMEVPDCFHVVKKLNDVVDGCRKELLESSETTKSEKKKVKAMNWVIRYKQENMNQEKRSKLEQLEKINEPLYRVYLHKEAFFEFFTFKPNEVEQARCFLNEWQRDAEQIPFESFQYFVAFIKRHFENLLNIILTGRTSAFSEAINRRINVIIAMAHGYRCLDYLKLKILQRCGPIGRYWKSADPQTA
jgi:transposase